MSNGAALNKKWHTPHLNNFDFLRKDSMNSMGTSTRFHAFRFIFFAALLTGICSASQAQARYTYSTDGAEVTDGQTGLIWRRCSQGQNWNGSICSGNTTLLTHELALTHAKIQSGWRLPNAKELLSIYDISKTGNVLDTTAFPNTFAVNYWSSTPFTGNAKFALSVTHLGVVSGDIRTFTFAVRLVR